MKYKKPKYFSYLISIGIHGFLVLLFLFITISPDVREVEYLTIGFGTLGESNSKGKPVVENKKVPQPEKKEIKKEEKKVEVPKAENEDENEIRPVKEKTEKKEKKETEKIEEKPKPVEKETPDKKGSEEEETGLESFGYDIDFGGKGIRKIYSYDIPPYPPGVSKEIDVKLRFTIMPDGTVGSVFPLIKADSRLEDAAMSSLKKWRFEPLPPNVKQVTQTAVITFPFRLR